MVRSLVMCRQAINCCAWCAPWSCATRPLIAACGALLGLSEAEACAPGAWSRGLDVWGSRGARACGRFLGLDARGSRGARARGRFCGPVGLVVRQGDLGWIYRSITLGDE
jgi:hypothetical protein